MKRIVKEIIIILMIIESIFIYLTCRSLINKPSRINEVAINSIDEIPIKNGFALMLENENGEFIPSEDRSSWPDVNQYVYFNSECYNGDGKKEDSITYSFDEGTKKFKLSTDTSAYCYIKFAKKTSSIGKIMQNSDGQLETEENMKERGDTLRRFQGDAETVTNNYICFGSTNKDDCTFVANETVNYSKAKSNSDKYAYRIIGIVTEDNSEYNEEAGQLKVIKKEALNTEYSWHDESGEQHTWDNSDLNNGINGEYFLSNYEAYPYMRDRAWVSKIEIHTWPYTYVPNDASGYDSNTDAKTLYTREVGLWTSGSNRGISTNKISLMYAFDYALASSNGALCHYNASSSEYFRCQDSWINIINNDILAPYKYELTMSRATSTSEWLVYSDGAINLASMSSKTSIRPVFYIDKNFAIASGSGTIEDPYIFEEPIDNSETLTSICNSYDAMSECVQNGNLDEIENLETVSNMEERTDNLRRFQGKAANVTNNYICLGSTTECDLTNTTNSDKYSYRIIGIVKEANSETGEKVGQIKVIKTEALNTAYKWHNTTGDSVTWDNSDLNNGINGEYFLNNTTYGLYESKDNTIGTTGKSWSGLIANHTWRYSYVPYDQSNGIYNTTNGADVYSKEKELWDSGQYKGSSTKKVGLMYVHDYILATEDGNNKKCLYSESSDYTTCKGNWIYLWSTNDSGASDGSYEWAMSRRGALYAWRVDPSGSVLGDYVLYTSFLARPVFYLSEKIKLSGRGTITDPYIVTDVAD